MSSARIGAIAVHSREPMPVRTVLVMNDELLRHGLAHVVTQLDGIHLLADLPPGPGLAERLHALRPELLIVGAESATALSTLPTGPDPAPRVVAVIDGANPREPTLPMIRAGVIGVIDRRSPATDLLATLARIIDGHSALDTHSAHALIDEIRVQAEPDQARMLMLTRREREVLELLTDGLDNHGIAASLFISRSTVKFHLSNLMEKFGVHTRAALVAAALRVTPAAAGPARPPAPRR